MTDLTFLKILNGHMTATHDPIHFVYTEAILCPRTL